MFSWKKYFGCSYIPTVDGEDEIEVNWFIDCDELMADYDETLLDADAFEAAYSEMLALYEEEREAEAEDNEDWLFEEARERRHGMWD